MKTHTWNENTIAEARSVMTPASAAKEAGLDSLAQASRLSSIPISTLRDWFKNDPTRFHFVILACALMSTNDT